MRPLEERRREEGYVPGLKPQVSLLRSVFEDLLRFCAGIKRLALFDPDRLELVDHHSVPIQPRLDLHDAIQRLEVPNIVRNARVEQDVLNDSTNLVADGLAACDKGYSLTRLP